MQREGTARLYECTRKCTRRQRIRTSRSVTFVWSYHIVVLKQYGSCSIVQLLCFAKVKVNNPVKTCEVPNPTDCGYDSDELGIYTMKYVFSIFLIIYDNRQI